MKEKTKQMNVEVPIELHRALKAVAGLAGLKLTVLASDAFRWFVGDSSPEIEQRRQMCVNLLKKIDKRSFSGAPVLNLELA